MASLCALNPAISGRRMHLLPANSDRWRELGVSRSSWNAQGSLFTISLKVQEKQRMSEHMNITMSSTAVLNTSACAGPRPTPPLTPPAPLLLVACWGNLIMHSRRSRIYVWEFLSERHPSTSSLSRHARTDYQNHLPCLLVPPAH